VAAVAAAAGAAVAAPAAVAAAAVTGGRVARRRGGRAANPEPAAGRNHNHAPPAPVDPLEPLASVRQTLSALDIDPFGDDGGGSCEAGDGEAAQKVAGAAPELGATERAPIFIWRLVSEL
jgi:hypothetical protein